MSQVCHNEKGNMATIRKRKNSWQVLIRRKGIPPQTKTFATYSDAFKCFMGINLDILVIEDFILYKLDQDKSKIEDCKNQFKID